MIYKVLVSAKKNIDRYTLNLPVELTEAVDEVFAQQGITRTEAVRRMFAWFLDCPDEMKLHVLGQARGRVANELAEIMYERMRGETRAREPSRQRQRPTGS
jgi:hypothetical protein